MRQLWALLVLCVSTLSAQEQTQWIKPNAFTDSTGLRQIGLMSDGRAGLNDQMSLYAHPLMMFLAPTAELQVTWSEQADQALATYHKLSVPTPLMLLVQTTGEGGMIPPEANVGFLLGITNGVRYSRLVASGVITVHAGIEVGIGDPDPRSSIDLPILYPRMLAYYDGWVGEIGIVYERDLGEHFGMAFEAASFLNDQNIFLEVTPRISWHMGDHWSLHLDPVVTYGTYPYGNDWQWIILPDLTYRW